VQAISHKLKTAEEKIRAILTDVHGALLETQIDGFRRWSLDELRLVKRGKQK
jgi:hypothetical protein